MTVVDESSMDVAPDVSSLSDEASSPQVDSMSTAIEPSASAWLPKDATDASRERSGWSFQLDVGSSSTWISSRTETSFAGSWKEESHGWCSLTFSGRNLCCVSATTNFVGPEWYSRAT